MLLILGEFWIFQRICCFFFFVHQLKNILSAALFWLDCYTLSTVIKRDQMSSLFLFLATSLEHMFRSWLAWGVALGGFKGVEGCGCQSFRCFASPGGKDWQFALNHATCIMSEHVQGFKHLRSVMSKPCRCVGHIWTYFFRIMGFVNIYSSLLIKFLLITPLPVVALSLVSCWGRCARVWFLHSVLYSLVLIDGLCFSTSWLISCPCGYAFITAQTWSSFPYTPQLVFLLTFL